jgi:hypothetical protein
MTWLVYKSSPDGSTQIESRWGGKSGSTVEMRQILISAHLLDDGHIRTFTDEIFPYDIDRYTVVVRKVGETMRMMESSFARFGKVYVRIRKRVFTEVLAETPLLFHCKDE